MWKKLSKEHWIVFIFFVLAVSYVPGGFPILIWLYIYFSNVKKHKESYTYQRWSIDCHCISKGYNIIHSEEVCYKAYIKYRSPIFNSKYLV